MNKNLLLSGKAQIRRAVRAFCLCLFLGNIATQVLANSDVSAVNGVRQDVTVKGLVVDETGETVIGANIKVVGAATGAITDIDGKFAVVVPDGGKIEISFIGYTTQTLVVPKNGEEMKIILKEDSKVLDEVVVVGYGTQRVKDLTGAATSVKMDDIADLPGASIVDALAGKVNGLTVTPSSGRPGATGSFKVRQPMSFDGANSSFNQPLIVIDDVVQVDQNGEPDMTVFNMLDQSEIESMTILKDASAAIYGSRASAGVVLVKTKRGREGTPKISYSGKLDFADAVSHVKTMGAYETGVFTNRMINQLYANDGGNYTDYLYSQDELNAMKSLNYDWLDRAWSSSFSHRHSLSVNGGNDRVTYFASINYQKQDTNLGNVQDYDKWTFRTGGEVKVAAGLKLSASISGYGSEKTDVQDQAKIGSGPWGSQSNSHDYAQLRHMPKYIPIEVDVPDPLSGKTRSYYTSPWVGPHAVDNSTDANVGNGFAVWNFFANEASNARKNSDANGYNANFSLTYDVPFVKGLSVKGTYAINYSNKKNTSIGDYYTLARAANTNEAGMHLLGDYTQWNFINYGDPEGDDPNKKPRVVYGKNTTKTEQMNLMLTYARVFGKHDVAVTGVIERSEGEGDDQQLWYNGPGTSFNGASNTAGELSTDGNQTYSKKYESGSLSYIGRANYKYSDRYLLQFLFRADASTKFAPENYWGFFPTGSVGWVISEEKFFKNSPVYKLVDYLKLRYSLGKTGKDNVAAWQWLQIYNINPTGGLGFGQIGGEWSNGANINGTANRDIKWDSTIKQNIGLDFNMLSGRLSASIDYYYDKTKDLIMLVSNAEDPIYSGAKLPPVNYGKKDAWGWEFSLKWSDRISQSLIPSWGPVRYSVGMDYAIDWNKTVLGQDQVFTYPSTMDSKINQTGYRGPGDEWGFKVWKNTSQGDGMLRTQKDIDDYWEYLSNLATAAGTSPSYLGKSSKSDLKPGMLAYQDVAGAIDVNNKTIAGPNGIISRDQGEDYTKLASNRIHNINTHLSAQWGDFSWSAQLATSWGGYAYIYNDVAQKIDNGTMIWSQFSYVNDMFDPVENPNGKYPSMAVSGAYGERSDFWEVSSFRMFVRSMTLGYSLPKNLLKKVGIDKLQINLTGNNLWDFYNPYPDNFRNMYDDCRTGYPTLRTWTLGVNLTL